jgi:hypothetical protein
MTNLSILNLQVATALAGYVVIHRIYLRPWFANRPFESAVMPLLLLHVFRYLGLMLLAPGQIDPVLPRDGLAVIAWGDFASGISALLAAIAVHHRWPVAKLLVGLFCLVGFADFVVVGITAAEIGIFDADIGMMWFLATFFAPALLLSQIYIVYLLFRRRGGRQQQR